MESGGYWLLFLSAALAISLSPGPDLIYILSRTLSQGRKIGLLSCLGVASGAVVHILAAALGLSAIIATSALAFSIVKYAGAAYLVYLGISALLSKGRLLRIPEIKKPAGSWEAFRQGVLIDILNPKVAVFFMAFLPQFVRPELGHTSAQIIFLGLLVNLMGVLVEVLFVLAAGRLTSFLRHNSRISAWLDRLMGSILVGLGLRLALTENSGAG